MFYKTARSLRETPLVISLIQNFTYLVTEFIPKTWKMESHNIRRLPIKCSKKNFLLRTAVETL